MNANIYFGFPDNIFGKYITPVVSGLNFRIIASNNTWQYKNDIYELGVAAVRVGVFHEFLPDDYRLTPEGRSRYSLFLGLNYTYRGVLGDIISNDNVRTTLLGNDRTNFNALEFNCGFRLNNLRVEFQIPMFHEANHIDGFTGSQFLFTLKFIGGFGLKIDSQK